MYKCGKSIMAVTHLIRRNCNLRADKVDNNKYKCESISWSKILQNNKSFVRKIENNKYKCESHGAKL